MVLLLGGEVLQTKFGILGVIVTWAEQLYSYIGILEHASTNTNKSKSKELAGGSNLDLLAVTLLVQFGSVLHSRKWLWISVVGVPIAGVYSLYNAVYGGGASASNSNKSSNKSNNTAETSEQDDSMAAKRKRRAEKRRQKWG